MEMHESAQRAAEKIWQHVEPMERGAFALLDVEAIIDRECRVSELRDALEYLHAEQEGPPSLKSHRLRAWCAAMAKAESQIGRAHV